MYGDELLKAMSQWYNGEVKDHGMLNQPTHIICGVGLFDAMVDALTAKTLLYSSVKEPQGVYFKGMIIRTADDLQPWEALMKFKYDK